MQTKRKMGSALLLSTILLFVVLTMVVTLSYVTVMEQKMSQKTKSSVGSFFNADSGVEWALNKIATVDSDLFIGSNNAFDDSDISDGVQCPFGGCDVYFLDENGKVITDGSTKKISNIKAVRSVGKSQTGEVTERAIEAAVAAEGGGVYTAYGTTTCAIGYSPAYTGEAIFPHRYTGAVGAEAPAIGSVFCYDGSLSGSVGGPGVWWENGNRNTAYTRIDCAVCVK